MAEELTLTLDQAIAIALGNNSDILLGRQEVNKARSKVGEARAGLAPSVTAAAGVNYYRGYYNKDSTQESVQIGIKQYLYKGGKTSSTIAYQKYLLESAQFGDQIIGRNIILSVSKAFYALLLAQDLAEVNNAVSGNARAHLVSAQKRFEKGEVSGSQILKLQESLAKAEEAAVFCINQSEYARELLANLLSLDKKEAIKAEGEFIFDPKEVAFDAAFISALSKRPEIKQYETKYKAAQQAVSMAKADTRPQVYAALDYYGRSHGASGTSRNANDYQIAGLVLSWPFFDGWAARQKVSQAIVDVKEAQLNKDQLKKDIRLELKNAYVGLKNAMAKYNANKSEFMVSEDDLRAAKIQYAKGEASSLEVQTAEVALLLTKYGRSQTAYDYLVAKLEFEQASGG